MCMIIHEHSTFKTSIEANRGLINVFTDEKATNEQTHDLLNAQKIGEQGYINYVTHNILQLSSVLDAPVRLTTAPLKKTTKNAYLRNRKNSAKPTNI